MLEKGFHEDMDEQEIEDEGVSGSRGVPGPRDDSCEVSQTDGIIRSNSW